MNRRMIFYMVGNIILLEAALLILPALVALCYQEMNGVFSFSLTIIIAALTGGAMKLIFKPSNRVIYAREGFIIVTFAWIFLSLLGCLPFIISREIPDFFDAFFETVPFERLEIEYIDPDAPKKKSRDPRNAF